MNANLGASAVFLRAILQAGLGALIVLPWLNPGTNQASSQIVSWLVCAGVICLLLLSVKLSPERWSCSKSLVKISIVASVIASSFNAGIAILQYLNATPSWWFINASLGGAAYGNLRQPNLLATLMNLGTICMVGGMLCRHFAYSRYVRLALIFTAALVVFCLQLSNAMTASRTGLLQLVLLCLITWLLARQGSPSFHGYALGLTGALIFYGASLALLHLLAHFAGIEGVAISSRFSDPNAFSRIALWSNVMELIAQKPMSGHGWGSLAYAHYSTEFTGDRFMEMLDNAHNLPLHLAVELGLPVALAFCGLVIWGIAKAKPWRESRPERLMAWGILGVIGIHSMLEYPLWYGPFFLTAMLCVTILLQDTLQFFIQKWSIAGIKYARYAIRLIAISLLCFTAFAAFDYHRVSQIYLQPEERSSWYADDALGAAQKSVLFQSHAKFAELVITPLSRATAPRVLELSSELIHWSPEPRVIEKLIESSVMMGLDDLAAFHLKRYRVAYPQAHAQWAARAGLQPS